MVFVEAHKNSSNSSFIQIRSTALIHIYIAKHFLYSMSFFYLLNWPNDPHPQSSRATKRKHYCLCVLSNNATIWIYSRNEANAVWIMTYYVYNGEHCTHMQHVNSASVDMHYVKTENANKLSLSPLKRSWRCCFTIFVQLPSSQSNAIYVFALLRSEVPN